MKPTRVDLRVSSPNLEADVLALLIIAKYPPLEVVRLDYEHRLAQVRVDLRCLGMFLNRVPFGILVETIFKKGDIVLFHPDRVCEPGPKSQWARVVEVEGGVRCQWVTLRSQELLAGAHWVEGSPEWSETLVNSNACTLKRRTR